MPGPSKNTAKPHSRAHRGSTGPLRALVALPEAGCSLPVPELPAGRDWSDHERARWDELWSSPQATQWDESCRGTVAAVVVYETAILTGTASAWHAAEHRYACEALGLTPRALAALGWRIGEAGQ